MFTVVILDAPSDTAVRLKEGSAIPARASTRSWADDGVECSPPRTPLHVPLAPSARVASDARVAEPYCRHRGVLIRVPGPSLEGMAKPSAAVTQATPEVPRVRERTRTTSGDWL